MDVTVLLERIKEDKNEAFEAIVKQYQSSIQRYLYKLTGNIETARDLTQDTFIKVYDNIHKTGPDLNFNAWVYRIATNTAYQYHRRKKIIGFISLEHYFQPRSSNYDSRPENLDERMVIEETMRKIPYDQRICVILYHIEGFKTREIAETLDISEAAVRKRIWRGLEVFRQYYKGENTDEM